MHVPIAKPAREYIDLNLRYIKISLTTLHVHGWVGVVKNLSSSRVAIKKAPYKQQPERR